MYRSVVTGEPEETICLATLYMFLPWCHSGKLTSWRPSSYWTLSNTLSAGIDILLSVTEDCAVCSAPGHVVSSDCFWS